MKYAIAMGLSLLGVPYRWGGKSAIQGGLDCSGLVCEILRTEFSLAGEHSAQELSQIFPIDPSVGVLNPPLPGDLVFFGRDSKSITHVALVLNSTQMLEAGGGGHLILTDQDAIKANAMVRVRPINRRPDLVGYSRPKYTQD